MAKVATCVTPKPSRNWSAEAESLAMAYNLEGLRALYSEAQAVNAGMDVMEMIRGWADVAGKS